MTKAWWLGFPRFRCPHCGVSIDGVKFVGHFKLPRVKRKTENIERGVTGAASERGEDG